MRLARCGDLILTHHEYWDEWPSTRLDRLARRLTAGISLPLGGRWRVRSPTGDIQFWVPGERAETDREGEMASRTANTDWRHGLTPLTGAHLQAIDLWLGDRISWADVTPAARLYLVAPELLEACQALAAWFRADTRGQLSAGDLLLSGCPNELAGEVDKARSAIRAALGE